MTISRRKFIAGTAAAGALAVTGVRIEAELSRVRSTTYDPDSAKLFVGGKEIPATGTDITFSQGGWRPMTVDEDPRVGPDWQPMVRTTDTRHHYVPGKTSFTGSMVAEIDRLPGETDAEMQARIDAVFGA